MSYRIKLDGTTKDVFDIGLNKITLDASGVGAPWTWTFPVNAGSSGQVLQTDGAGNLSWTTSAAGPSVLQVCRGATTTNITLSGNVVLDGITTAPGDRILVKNQTTTTQNGIYVAAAGAWSRAADDPTTVGAHIPISFGITNSATVWRYSATNTFTQIGDRIAMTTATGTTGMTMTLQTVGGQAPLGAFATRWNGRGNQDLILTLGGTLNVSNGGTGKTTLSTGAVLVGAGTSAVAEVVPTTAGQVLTSNGAGVAPTWQAPGAASDTTTPYYVPTGETFTVNLYKQALFTLPITIDGTIVLDGILVEV